MMLTSSAGNLLSSALYEHTAVPPMVKELVQCGWMTWHARGARLICMNADTVDGETMTALTVEMPVSGALTDLVTFVWRMEVFTLAVLRFTSMDSGERCR